MSSKETQHCLQVQQPYESYVMNLVVLASCKRAELQTPACRTFCMLIPNPKRPGGGNTGSSSRELMRAWILAPQNLEIDVGFHDLEL